MSRNQKDARDPRKGAKAKKNAARKEASIKDAAKTDAPVTPVLSVAATLPVLVLAWLVPGAGHFRLGRRARAVAFFVVVLATLAIGWSLAGKVFWTFSGAPLEVLGTWGSLGSGLPFLVLRLGLGFTGDINAAGWDYGKTSLLSAGLMNLLLLLDVWDIARGRKE